MKLLLLMLYCLSIVYGASLIDQDVQILKYENNVGGKGNYNYEFETSDGTKKKEKSEIVNAGDPKNEKIVVTGEFEYIGPDGVTYQVMYIADENGFQPQGKHLPTATSPPPLMPLFSPRVLSKSSGKKTPMLRPDLVNALFAGVK